MRRFFARPRFSPLFLPLRSNFFEKTTFKTTAMICMLGFAVPAAGMAQEEAADEDRTQTVTAAAEQPTSSVSSGAISVLRAIFGGGRSTVTELEDSAPEDSAPSAPAPGTHEQTAVIQPSTDQGPDGVAIQTFALGIEGRLYLGCGEEPGEIRVLDADGKYLASWEVPIRPDAIHVTNAGTVYVAGSGRLVRLSADGQVEKNVEAPHLAAIELNSDKIRQDLIDSNRRAAEQYDRLVDNMQQQVDRIQKTIDDAKAAEEEVPAALQARLSSYQARVEAYKQLKDRMANQELSDEAIQQRVTAMKRSKERVASISATEDSVLITCGAQSGAGYEVWRMDREFADGRVIITGLRGCCGQMDAQANGDRVYVAENTRHRVGCFDLEGAEVCAWGKSDRNGDAPDGFGSCCNPMNVTFGDDGTVYTAESNTGRIKRFDQDGKYLATIGQVDLVPGCKNVSIAVNQDGSRVYMLDITRKHIVMMQAKEESGEADKSARVESSADRQVTR
jgi:sugar lactone lactonase YvrE